MFNAIKFYRDFKIPTSTEGKHGRTGWIQVHCPFCVGSKNFHLGFHLESGAYNCYRCGPKSQFAVIRKLLNCHNAKAKEILDLYQGSARTKTPKAKKDAENALECVLPFGSGQLQEQHIKYLHRRNFEAEKLVAEWGLVGTGHLGPYKHRIVAPIYFNGKLVSYQGRDITGKSELRYKACPQEKEVIPHQNIVYGLDNIKGGSCVVVEGIFDVFRLGYGSVCCFGTAFTINQAVLIAGKCNNVFVLFDSDDDNAIQQAEKLASFIGVRGSNVEIIELDKGDPADMKQEDADLLMKELGF